MFVRLLPLLLIGSFCSCAQTRQAVVSSGEVELVTIVSGPVFKEGIEGVNADGLQTNQRFLFSDSIVLFESKSVLLGETEETGAVNVCNYFLIDLRTKWCTVFGTVADTARPVYKFPLKEGTSVGWVFFRSKNKKNADRGYHILKDTVIGEARVRRVKFINRIDSTTSTTVSGSDKFPITLFRFSPSTERILQPYIPYRTETRQVGSGRQTIRSFRLVRDYLDSKEVKMLQRLRENALMSQVPVFEKEINGKKAFGLCQCHPK